MVFRTGFFPKKGLYCIFFVLLHVIQVCFADRKKKNFIVVILFFWPVVYIAVHKKEKKQIDISF